MEMAATPFPRARTLAATLRFDGRAVAAWTLGFAPVLYLALRGGGYDISVRSEVGLAVWWIVLVGVAAGVLRLSGIGRLGWLCIGLLSAFALWSLIATSWSESAENTVTEVGRLVTYLGFLVLALCVVRRDTVRPLVTGMAVAFGAVGLLAVLSRLYPGAFPSNTVDVFFPGAAARLNYPLNYADGTGNFLAIGIPLLILIATRARTIAGQALGAASLPVTVLAIVLTASRGAVLTAIVGIVVFYALAPDRLPKLATGLAGAAGSFIVITALLHRHAVRDGLSTPLAVSQRHQLIVLMVVVCVGVALVQVAIGLAARYALRPRALRISRRAAARSTAVVLAVAVVIAVVAGVPGEAAHQWNVLKHDSVTGVVSGNVYGRLMTVTGSHRYQYWQAALHAFESKPLTGIGPGTFQFYWAQHRSIGEYVVNAHSLYLETLAETGLVGGLLIVALLLVLLVAGVARALRAPPLARTVLAAATAAFAGFCAAAGYDWMWQLAVAPVAALLLGATILAYHDQRRPAESRPGWRRWSPRVAVGTLAICALVAVAIPFATTEAIRSSQADVGAGHLQAALNDAATAQRLEPYAATPRLQRALILEQEGDLHGAQAAIEQAAAREPTNWQIWLIRSRIDAESGNALSAVRDYRRAHVLDPLSRATVIPNA
jgi:O-Antigen ligase